MSRSLKWTRLVGHETTSSNGVVRLFGFHMSEIVRRALGKERKWHGHEQIGKPKQYFYM